MNGVRKQESNTAALHFFGAELLELRLRIYLVVLTQPVVSLIGNDDTGLLGIDSGVREVGGVSESASSDGLEKRRFANVRETNLSSCMSKSTTEEDSSTHNSTLQTVSRPPEHNLLLFLGLLGRHCG